MKINQAVVAGLSPDPAKNLNGGLTLLPSGTSIARVLDTSNVEGHVVYYCQFEVKNQTLFGHVPRHWVDMPELLEGCAIAPPEPVSETGDPHD